MTTITLPKLRPGVKTRWVEALRSGRYKQGVTALRTDGPEGQRFCCLGVLCDLAEQDGVSHHDDPNEVGLVCYDGSSAMPQKCVEQWAYDLDDPQSVEVFDRLWCVIDPTQPECIVGLSTLNDGRQYTFNAIADKIEADL